MSVSDFIKQNFVLVLGITLPLLLVIGFMITAAVPPQGGAKPLYPVLYSIYNYDHSAPYNIEYVVKENKLYARLTARKDEYSSSRRDLYIFDPQSDVITKLDPALPSDLGGDKQIDVAVSQFDNKHIDNASKSPDGYTLENGSYRSRGIVGDLFGGRSGYYESHLRHESGYTYKIPSYAGRYRHSNVDFIGWVVNDPNAK